MVQDLIGCGRHCCRTFIFPVTIVDHIPLNLDFFWVQFFFFLVEICLKSPQMCFRAAVVPVGRLSLSGHWRSTCVFSVSSTRNTRWDEILDFLRSWKHKYCRDKHLCCPCRASGLCRGSRAPTGSFPSSQLAQKPGGALG